MGIRGFEMGEGRWKMEGGVNIGGGERDYRV
jgi:hypothetical protein